MNFSIGDSVIIGAKDGCGTFIDPLTSVTGRRGTLRGVGEKNGQYGAFVELDEPVNDAFGVDQTVVIVEPEYLEPE